MGKNDRRDKEVLPTISELTDESKHLNAAIAEEKNDLPCVLICASFLEKALGALLLSHFVDGKTSRKMVDPNGGGAISSFQSRADIAYCLGMISKEDFNYLGIIGQIRNAFAHSHKILSFKDPSVSALCNRLAGAMPGRSSPKIPAALAAKLKQPKSLFATACVWLLTVLQMRCGSLEQIKRRAPATWTSD